jgi:hypothetical protein
VLSETLNRFPGDGNDQLPVAIKENEGHRHETNHACVPAMSRDDCRAAHAAATGDCAHRFVNQCHAGHATCGIAERCQTSSYIENNADVW